MIGDADDGYVVRLAFANDFCPYRSLLATGALLFDRADLAYRGGALEEKTLWLLGEEMRPRYEALRAQARGATTPARSWPHTGYHLLGMDFDTPREIRMLVDTGPLGYLTIAAHGHADALSLMLNVAGHEILIDPGTYCYHTEPDWRRYFRSTCAHNTLQIDGLDQSVQQGNFMWSDHANCTLLAFTPYTSPQRLRARHDGYRRLTDPVTHTREVIFDPQTRVFDILDELACERPHTIVQAWHFGEHVEVTLEGAAIIARSGPVTVRIEPERSVDGIHHLRGSDDPPGGWVSRSFGVRKPTSTVLWCDAIDGNTCWRTRIMCEISAPPTSGADIAG
jgi:hypothetical protein